MSNHTLFWLVFAAIVTPATAIHTFTWFRLDRLRDLQEQDWKRRVRLFPKRDLSIRAEWDAWDRDFNSALRANRAAYSGRIEWALVDVAFSLMAIWFAGFWSLPLAVYIRGLIP